MMMMMKREEKNELRKVFFYFICEAVLGFQVTLFSRPKLRNDVDIS